MKPLCIDLFCGLGGWAEGFLAEGWDVIGFDIERHDYGTGGYPAQLVLQDVRTLHGSQLKDATVIVGSSPCQRYSYMAMPWTRAKQMASEYRSGVRSIKELNELFNAQFRLQREASEASGRYIPLIVENVRGAQPWVGRSRWHYGSFHLWGDVPALMPMTPGHPKVGNTANEKGSFGLGFNWQSEKRWRGGMKTVGHVNIRADHVKHGGDWFSGYGGGFGCDHSQMRQHSSKSPARKAASAQIAKIPFPLASHIAKCFNPLTRT